MVRSGSKGKVRIIVVRFCGKGLVTDRDQVNIVMTYVTKYKYSKCNHMHVSNG